MKHIAALLLVLCFALPLGAGYAAGVEFPRAELPGPYLTEMPHQAPAASQTGRLLALARSLQDNREVLATVNPTTGDLSPIGSGLGGCCTASVLDAALDTAGKRFYAVMALSGESSQRVITFNTVTGAATASEPLTDTLAVNYMAYDPSDGQLLALTFHAPSLTSQVVRIDPSTAAMTPLGSAIANCCSPKSFDAAYDGAQRRLYLVVQPFDGGTQSRLLTISGADGALLSNVPIADPYAVNHMIFDAADDTLWALVSDPQADAQRLARVDPSMGDITALGDGAAACCALLPTDVALDGAGTLVAPMIDTSDPLVGDTVSFFRYALATGAVLSRAPVDPSYELHYIGWEELADKPADTELHLPLIQSFAIP
jgi:hypothetical protein